MIGNDRSGAKHKKVLTNSKLRNEKTLSNAVPRSMIGNDPGRVKWIASHPAFVPAHLSLGGNIKLQNPKGS